MNDRQPLDDELQSFSNRQALKRVILLPLKSICEANVSWSDIKIYKFLVMIYQLVNIITITM